MTTVTKKAEEPKHRVDPRVERQITEARRVQERRLQAPEITMRELIRGEIPIKKTMKLYCPEAFGKNPKFHARFCDAKKLDQRTAQGYELVIHHGTPVRNDGGDYLMRTPIALFKRKLALAPKISKARLRRAVEQYEQQNKAGGAGMRNQAMEIVDNVGEGFKPRQLTDDDLQ